MLGRVVTLTRVEGQMAAGDAAINLIGYVNDDHDMLKATTSMMGMELEIILCDQAFAESTYEPMDFITRSLIESPVPIPRDGRDALTFVLDPDGESDFHLPSDATQQIQVLDDGRLLVSVVPVAPPSDAPLPYAGDDEEALAALQPSPDVESDNEAIVTAARQAIGDADNAAEAVQRLQQFVHHYITTKDLSVGYATAAEVFASRQGDCTEHAVLLAAMCRAVGIPAELVDGLAYVQEFAGHHNVFGAHAWVRCYIGDRWVHADAVWPNGPDAARIMLSHGEGLGSVFAVVTSFGRFDILEIRDAAGHSLSPAPEEE